MKTAPLEHWYAMQRAIEPTANFLERARQALREQLYKDPKGKQ